MIKIFRCSEKKHPCKKFFLIPSHIIFILVILLFGINKSATASFAGEFIDFSVSLAKDTAVQKTGVNEENFFGDNVMNNIAGKLSGKATELLVKYIITDGIESKLISVTSKQLKKLFSKDIKINL